MDPATIAALSGAPPTVILAWVIFWLLRDRRRGDANRDRVLNRLAVTIQRQSALLLVVVEHIVPGRAEEVERQVRRLYDLEKPSIADSDHDDDD